jgi:hypothetical protein
MQINVTFIHLSMKKISAALLVLISLFIFSCSDKDNNDNQPAVACKLLSVYFNTDSARMYHYDDSGKLILKWDLFEQGPDFLSSHYIYQNDRVVCFYRSQADSTFFNYDSQGRISSYEWHYYTMGTKQKRLTTFTYNASNKVVTETGKAGVQQGGKGVLSNDSSVYTYQNGNVRTRDYYYWSDTSYVGHYHYEYLYDSGNNYFAITGEPKIKYYQWNRNNIIGSSLDSQQATITDTIRTYNSQGYPLLIRDSQGYDITLTYSCQ